MLNAKWYFHDKEIKDFTGHDVRLNCVDLCFDIRMLWIYK